MRVGDRIELELERIDGRGCGRGRVDERELVVPGAFAGERVSVRVEALARHSNLAHARVRELLRASPHRRPLACARHEHAPLEPGRSKPACGGCPLLPLEHAEQLEQLRATMLAEHALALNEPIVSGEEFGYRWSSKRIVAGRRGALVLGSRTATGDRVADMHGCRVDHPRIEAAFAALERLGNALNIEAWRADGSGDLRYVWAKTNGEQVLLTLITGKPESRAASELAVRLHADGLVDGVAHAVQADEGNAIRGEPPVIVAGLSSLPLTLAGVAIEIGPLGFLQPNPRVAELAYRDLVGPPPGSAEPAPSGALAFDLYAGAGVTTSLLRERFTEVIACESYDESARALGVPAQSVEDFCQAWLETRRPTPQLVIANPPRAGMGARVCASLLELGPARVQIMSCHGKTLAEDLRRLAPRYALVGLRAYDTLPHTPHLELVAWLSRG
jgi:23S rRNA (uracil1939-C5)-methyltransferase